jgi:hypothetical protein
MNPTTELSQITNGSGFNIRGKYTPYYDTLTLASGTLNYSAFQTAVTDGLDRNKKFPLSGSEIFYIMALSVELPNVLINTTTLYEGLISLMQGAYLQIKVNAKERARIPLFECLSFIGSSTIGTSGQFINVDIEKVMRARKLVQPILINKSTSISVNIVMETTAATNFNTKLLKVTFYGKQSDVLNPAYNYNPVQGNNFEALDYCLFSTVSISTANQFEFSLLNDDTLADTRKSSVLLPLPDNNQFQAQRMWILFTGKDSDTTESLDLIYANRSRNYLKIISNSVTYLESSLSEMINIVTAYPNTFNDNAGTPVATNAVLLQTLFQYKLLETPIVFPPTGNVKVSLLQPGSSLNNGRLLTIGIDGRLIRPID